MGVLSGYRGDSYQRLILVSTKIWGKGMLPFERELNNKEKRSLLERGLCYILLSGNEWFIVKVKTEVGTEDNL